MIYHELVRKKEHLEEALHNIKLALESDTYTKPFAHEVKNQLKAAEFEHITIKTMIEECSNRKMGFDPDLVLQLAEEEVHRQFTDMVKENIKARPIEVIFNLKHELELFMLKERNDMYTKGLEKVTADLKGIDDALNEDAHETLPVDLTLVEAVAIIEEACPEVLTDKEIKQVLKIPAKKKKK